MMGQLCSTKSLWTFSSLHRLSPSKPITLSLFALDLKDYKLNIVKIHKAVSNKIAGIPLEVERGIQQQRSHHQPVHCLQNGNKP
jgi:hypothetical protein